MPDLSHSQLDSVGIQRFLLKYLDKQISARRIEGSLIHRRINKLKTNANSLTFASFYSLFVGASKSLLVTQSTPGRPSRWTNRPKSKINFNPRPALEFKDTKPFQKEGPSQAEELLAFKKYLVAQLNLDVKLENLRIATIANPSFVLEDSFSTLAGPSSSDSGPDHITPESLFDFISNYGDSDLTQQDCTHFIVSFGREMTLEVYKQSLILPKNADFI